MTVADLKTLLLDAPDEMEVLIPLNTQFDGMFLRPCIASSGVVEMGTEDLDDEEIAEMKLLDKSTHEKSFVLVPHGYFEIDEDEVPPELN